MVDRNKVKALASYKEIVSQGYNDVSGKIQVKKGAFQFDKKPIEYSAYWHEAYRTYIITSAGTVRALKGPASHVIANVDLNSLSSYDKGLKAILVDIEEFEGKIKRRQELSKGREDYLQTILDKPLVVKKRIVSVFFIKWIFGEMVERFFGWQGADKSRQERINDWKKALTDRKELDRRIKDIVGGGYLQALNKDNVRIVKSLL